jgi:hypothetical protein
MRSARLAAAFVVAVTVAALLPAGVAGQAQGDTRVANPANATASGAERGAGAPRAERADRGRDPGVMKTPWGHPDLQGLWNVATMTPLERPDNVKGKLTLTDAESRAIEQAAAANRERRLRPSNANRDAPPVGGDGSTGAAGNVGGYNTFWIDNGDSNNRVDGQIRTSIIVDPPDGRVPPTLPAAMKRNAARLRATPTSDAPENVVTRAPGAYDDIEQRPLAERCILAFGSSSGPPMMPVLYNNLKQIIQTKEYVTILNEMVHDARIIPFRSQHAPAHIKKWFGDSIARWEGDTLVVETTNFTDKTRFRGSSENLKITERFTRVDAKTLLYRFTVEDPATWARPWSGEYSWPIAEADDRLYEYACHEHNYAMGDIMRGERLLEAEAAAAKTGTKP